MNKVVRLSLRAFAPTCSQRVSSVAAPLQLGISQSVFSNRNGQVKRFSTTDSKPTETAESVGEETKGEAGAETTEEVPPPPASPEIMDTKDSRIRELEKEVKDLKDKVMRSYAEEENVRRIARRDVTLAKDFANQSFAKSMLEVADDFERAMKSVPEEAIIDNKEFNTLLEGIKMTDKSLQKTFAKNGVVKFGEVDDVFDPALHDALFNIPATETQTGGTIGQVLKSGYKLKDRVIRAADVGIRVKPDQ